MSAPKKMSIDETLEILVNTGTKEWNEALSCRLESLRAYLLNDEWAAIEKYLKSITGAAMNKLLTEGLTPEAYQYLRGVCAGLRIAYSLPKTVESGIQQEVSAKKNSDSRGSAGY